MILISCSTSTTLEQIRTKLESKEQFEQKDPTSIREFEPYLNGSWIGNAVAYSCYRGGQAPGIKGPTKQEILEDLKLIKKYWNLIRIYNADDDAERILSVIQEHDLSIKVMLGVWLENEEEDSVKRENNITNVVRSIELTNKYPGIIIAVNVGNETQVFWSWHRMNTQNLIHYIRAVRNNITLPVTTADDYNFWNKPESEIIADEVDFIVTHIYPLWNGKTLNNAILWLDSIYQDVQSKHPEQQIILGEIGWATQYNPDKKGEGEQGSLVKGEVSILAQEKFLINLNNWIDQNQITTFLFEVFDEPWKGGGDNSGPTEIEKNWGVFYEDRTPKESFKNFLLYKTSADGNMEFNILRK